MSALVFQGNGCAPVAIFVFFHLLLDYKSQFFWDSFQFFLQIEWTLHDNIIFSQREGILRFFIENGRKILLLTK